MSERPLFFFFRLRMHFEIRGRSYPQRLRRIVGKALSVVSKLGLPVGVFRLRRLCARPHCYGECHGFFLPSAGMFGQPARVAALRNVMGDLAVFVGTRLC
jgi:hypothetical protein